VSIGTTMGNLEGGLFTRGLKKWMNGAVEVERLSLRGLYKAKH
jgi:hypothetical protein